MRILVTGAKGQLGYDVVNELIERSHAAIGVDMAEMDITDGQSVADVMRNTRPDAVIHCAAWTDVDAAEDSENSDRVHLINAVGTGHIARMCKELDSRMIYLSTDYVFNGQGTRPWKPDDSCSPINVYGQSKYAGELAVEEWLEKYYIVRIAWVFGANGSNFVKKMLSLGKTRNELAVVCDQIGTPTYTKDLAVLLADMAESDRYGKYHATNEGGYISWFEFAQEIFGQARMRDSAYEGVSVIPADSGAYPSKARRPANSRLNKSKLLANGFKALPPWQDALARYMDATEV